MTFFDDVDEGWESVTRPLDRLPFKSGQRTVVLGISHQTP